MLDTIKRFLAWLIKMGKMAWSYFRKDVSDKLSSTKSITAQETVSILGKESVYFFASAAKRFREQRSHISSKSRMSRFLNMLRLPYEHCFANERINLPDFLYQFLKPLLMRLWTGKRVYTSFVTVDLSKVGSTF